MARLLPPETAHNLTIQALKYGLAEVASKIKCPSNAGVTLKNSKLKLANRIGLAAGFDKNADVFDAMLKLGFGFVECGTVTPKPQAGNPSPRVFRLLEDEGVINRLGFNNKGLDRFVSKISASNNRIGPVGVNLGANKTSVEYGRANEDYITGMRAVWPYADYITLNISSPNTPGLRNLQYIDELRYFLDEVGTVAESMCRYEKFCPVFLKVAPDLEEEPISQIAKASLEAPYLHGLIVSNTTVSRPETLKSPNKAEYGGLSGKPLTNLSTKILKLFAGEVGDRLDIIGVGGVSATEDVQSKLEAGAQAVQLYTGLTYRGLNLIKELVSFQYETPSNK